MTEWRTVKDLPDYQVSVVLIKDGVSKVYKSETDAAKDIGSEQSDISAAVRGKRKSINGYAVKKAKPRHIGKRK